MRSIFTITITFFLLTACSQTPSPLTQTPTVESTNTPLPTPTGTPAPSATPTITPIPTFSPEAWAGTDAGRLEFLQNMKDLGVTDYTCGADGKCMDAEGKDFFDAATGNYEFPWLQVALANSGIVEKKPNYKPVVNPVFPSYVTHQVFGEYFVPLAAQFHADMLKKGVDVYGETAKAGAKEILIDKEHLEWGLVVGQSEGGDLINKYLIVRTVDKEVIGFPIGNITIDDLMIYWQNK
jgi:hypothetical protein